MKLHFGTRRCVFQKVAISYSRGVIKIVDLEMLKAMSCECCETLREQGIEVEEGESPR
jgi:hypothetical protein